MKIGKNVLNMNFHAKIDLIWKKSHKRQLPTFSQIVNFGSWRLWVFANFGAKIQTFWRKTWFYYLKKCRGILDSLRMWRTSIAIGKYCMHDKNENIQYPYHHSSHLHGWMSTNCVNHVRKNFLIKRSEIVILYLLSSHLIL